MSVEEAAVYYEKLSVAKATRFNLLTKIGLQLGKPIEGAYEYAHTIMESDK